MFEMHAFLKPDELAYLARLQQGNRPGYGELVKNVPRFLRTIRGLVEHGLVAVPDPKVPLQCELTDAGRSVPLFEGTVQ